MQNSLKALVVLACLGGEAASASPNTERPQLPSAAPTITHHGVSAAINDSCHLGFISAGSPLVITRISPLLAQGGIEVSDRLLEINGVTIEDQVGMAAVVSDSSPGDDVTLLVARDNQAIRVRATCTNGDDTLQARYDALKSAADGDWDACIRHTLVEEVHWGGISSQSAGLRLWCHQGKSASERAGAAQGMTRVGAQFVFDYLNALLDEIRHVPGGMAGVRLYVSDGIRLLDNNGHWLLSRELSNKLQTLDSDLLAAHH